MFLIITEIYWIKIYVHNLFLGSRGVIQQGLLSSLPQQRRMSDESIQSGAIETQEMQTIQV